MIKNNRLYRLPTYQEIDQEEVGTATQLPSYEEVSGASKKKESIGSFVSGILSSPSKLKKDQRKADTEGLMKGIHYTEAEPEVKVEKPKSTIDDPVGDIITPLEEKFNESLKNLKRFGGEDRLVAESTAQKPLVSKLPPQKTIKEISKAEFDKASGDFEEGLKTVEDNLFPSGIAAGEYVKQMLSEHGVDKIKDNKTVQLAFDKFQRYERLKQMVKAEPNLLQLAVDLERTNDKNFDKQVLQLEGGNENDRGLDNYMNVLPQVVNGAILNRLINSKDLQTLATEDENVKRQLDELKDGGIYRLIPEYGEVVARNILSREYQKRRANKVINPIFEKSTYLDNLADEVFKDNPALKEIADTRLKGNWEGKIDTPGIVDEAGTGARRTFQQMGESFKDAIGAGKLERERITEGLQQEYGGVSSGVSGAWQKLGQAANFGGMLLAMAATGGVGRGIGMSPKAAHIAVTGGTFLDEEKNRATMKFPGEPGKANLGALAMTTLYTIGLRNGLPAKQLTDVLSKARPEITQTIKNLSADAVEAEIKNGMSSALQKAVKGTFTGAAEMVGLTTINQTLDKALGLNGETFSKYHPDNELAEVAESMIIGLAAPQLISGIGNRKAVSNSLYNMAEYPQRYKDILSQEPQTADIQKRIQNIDFLAGQLNLLKEKGITEPNQKRFLLEAMNEKFLNEKLEGGKKEPKGALTRQAQDELKEHKEIQERILAGEDAENIVTEAQQEKIDKTNDAKTEIERLTERNQLDNKEMDFKRKDLDGRNPEDKIKIEKLEQQRKEKNEDFEKKVADQQKEIEPEEKPEQPERKATHVIMPEENKVADVVPLIKTESKPIATPVVPEVETHESVMKRAKTGEPIEIDALRIQKSDKTNDETGVFFADKGIVEEYQKREKEGFYGEENKGLFSGDVKKHKLTFKNPLVVRSQVEWVHKLAKEGDKEAREIMPDYEKEYVFGTTHKTHPEFDSFVAKKARELEYDGIITPLEYVALDNKSFSQSKPQTEQTITPNIKTETDASSLPIGQSAKEISRNVEAGENIPESSERVRPSEQGNEPPGTQEEGREGKGKEKAVGDGGKEPPKSETAAGLSSEGKNELDKLANNIPDSGKVAEYMSKETIEKYTGETPTNDQSRGVQELGIALNHGEKIIEKAKELFGKDYAEKTLDYIDNSSAGVSNKALMYVSLENALGREKLANPERAGEITKQQELVYEQSQKFARENSLALNYQKLRRIAKVGYDVNKVTDSFFSAEELADKKDLEKAVEADPDAINKAAEQQEVGLTVDIEKKIQEGVEKEIEKIYEKLPKEKRSLADRALAALEAVQAKLRSKTYDATAGIPVAIVDAGITTIRLAIKAGVKVADAIELGIRKIKEKWGKEWAKEDDFRNDLRAVFKDIQEAKPSVSTKEIVKNALIEKGFGREVTVKGEKKAILDWKKLAGRFGSIEKIRENVNAVLQEKGLKGLTDAEKGMIKEDFLKEYVDLRSSVIEKAQNELAKRNKETVSPEQKTAAKKLAELYTYGLFESKPEEFENTLNKALGAKVSEEGFAEAKKIAKALESIYDASFKGVKLNDVSAKAAIEKLEDRLRILLFRESKKQGNFALKAASIVRNYFEIQQTMILNNLKQAVENPFSGLQQNIIDKIQSSSNSTPQMVNQRRKLMKDVYKDMVLQGGVTYGKVESQFVNRQHLDDYVNKLSDGKLYHGIMSIVTGKATLNAMDAMYKAGITEKKFTNNLITILTHETNPKRMNKEDAVKFVAEKLTGQNFKDAQVTAKKIIEKINKDAGHELVSTNQNQVDRFANDIVKSSLEMGQKITSEQVEAAYNAAYKAAGLGLGHEANNLLSGMIKGMSARMEGDINKSVKDKEWNRAAMLTMKSILFRNILNPFVGGGTNWLVLKLEKTGLGLLTGLAYKVGSKSRIDLTTKQGLAHLESRLYNQSRWKDNMMRGLVGGSASMLTYLGFMGLAGTDDYRKWRAKNQWAARYLDLVTPEVMLAQMAVENDAVKKYVAQSFNKNDAFDASTKAVKSLDFAAKGKSNEAWGAMGEMVGGWFNAPVPWRLVKDGQVIYQGVKGQDPYHGNYQPSQGFFNGVFQGGAIEWLGLRPNPDSQSTTPTKQKGKQTGNKSKGRKVGKEN